MSTAARAAAFSVALALALAPAIAGAVPTGLQRDAAPPPAPPASEPPIPPPDSGPAPEPPQLSPPPPVAYEPVSTAVPPPAARERSGFFIGVGLGVANLTVYDEGSGGDDSESFTSLAYGIHFGGLITPRLGIGVAVAGSSHTEELEDRSADLTVYQNNLVAFVQYWVLERIWLRAGLGAANVGGKVEGSDAEEYPGVGFVGTAAYEVMHTVDYSLDLGIGLWAAQYEGAAGSTTTGTFEMQFSWY
jgi:hypothetical protein